MRDDARPLLKTNNGDTLMSAPRGDEYWLAPVHGEAIKIPVQKAVRLWLIHERGDFSKVIVPPVRGVTATAPLKAPAVPPPIPPQAAQKHCVDRRANGGDLESWQNSLLRKLGLDHDTIEDAVEADRQKQER